MSNFNTTDMLNVSMMDAGDLVMKPYGDDNQMGMGDLSAVPLNSVEPTAGSIPESEHRIQGEPAHYLLGLAPHWDGKHSDRIHQTAELVSTCH
jgi:hypothetical protein